MVIFDERVNRTGTNCAKYDEMYQKYGTDILPCAVADMDFRPPKPIRKAIETCSKHGIFGYTNLTEDFGKLVSEWVKRRYHCDIHENGVVFSPRINMGLNMAVETLTNRTDSIIVHTPAYPALTAAVKGYGRNLIEAPLICVDNTWKMDFKSLEKQIDHHTKMFLLCNPHNPTGRVWSMEELREVENFCLKHGLLLLSDEIHGDIIRKENTFHSVLELSDSMREKTIVYQSITKSFNVPGIILSYMLIPNEELCLKMRKTVDRWGLHNPNTFAAAIIHPALTECDSWLQQLNSYLDENIRFLVTFLKEKLPDFSCMLPEGTYLVWIDYKKTGFTGLQAEEFFYKKAKIGVYMGTHFGTSGEGYIRLNVGVPKSLLEEILEKIYHAYTDRVRVSKPPNH